MGVVKTKRKADSTQKEEMRRQEKMEEQFCFIGIQINFLFRSKMLIRRILDGFAELRGLRKQRNNR